MSLTAEQQSQVDLQNALEEPRNTHQLAVLARQTRLEAIRLAKEVLIENARSKTADQRDVAAADITAYAGTLITYINT